MRLGDTGMTHKENIKSKLILEAAINHRNTCQVNLNLARNELAHAQDDLDQSRRARAFLVKQGDTKE